MAKPIVHYRPSLFNFIKLGMGALVQPIDHPNFKDVSNLQFVRTSQVIDITTDGFETRNTIYKEQA